MPARFLVALDERQPEPATPSMDRLVKPHGDQGGACQHTRQQQKSGPAVAHAGRYTGRKDSHGDRVAADQRQHRGAVRAKAARRGPDPCSGGAGEQVVDPHADSSTPRRGPARGRTPCKPPGQGRSRPSTTVERCGRRRPHRRRRAFFPLQPWARPDQHEGSQWVGDGGGRKAMTKPVAATEPNALRSMPRPGQAREGGAGIAPPSMLLYNRRGALTAAPRTPTRGRCSASPRSWPSARCWCCSPAGAAGAEEPLGDRPERRAAGSPTPRLRQLLPAAGPAGGRDRQRHLERRRPPRRRRRERPAVSRSSSRRAWSSPTSERAAATTLCGCRRWWPGRTDHRLRTSSPSTCATWPGRFRERSEQRRAGGGEPHDRGWSRRRWTGLLVHMYHEIERPTPSSTTWPGAEPGPWWRSPTSSGRRTCTAPRPRCSAGECRGRLPQVSFPALKGDIGYLAVFEPPSADTRPQPQEIRPCRGPAR